MLVDETHSITAFLVLEVYLGGSVAAPPCALLFSETMFRNQLVVAGAHHSFHKWRWRFTGNDGFCYIAPMAKEVPIGVRGEAEMTVESEHTLRHHNPELPLILSTPQMIALMEWAAAKATLEFCSEGEITVGTAINIEHRAPTTVGARVKAEAVLESTNGRFLVFRVTAHNGKVEIGRGTVTRTFVNPAKTAEKPGTSVK
jgi:predicted thioesterase